MHRISTHTYIRRIAVPMLCNENSKQVDGHRYRYACLFRQIAERHQRPRSFEGILTLTADHFFLFHIRIDLWRFACKVEEARLRLATILRKKGSKNELSVGRQRIYIKTNVLWRLFALTISLRMCTWRVQIGAHSKTP